MQELRKGHNFQKYEKKRSTKRSSSIDNQLVKDSSKENIGKNADKHDSSRK